MRVHYASDLHLEFERGDTHTLDIPDGDILVLAGDIYTAWSNYTPLAEDFFDEVSYKFKHVVYVLGNHEHYGGYFNETVNRIRAKLAKHRNIYVLNNQTIYLDKFAIFGATFWTDICGEHPLYIEDVKRGMNDYYEIRESMSNLTSALLDGKAYVPSSPITPRHTIKENSYSRYKLKEFLSLDTKMQRLVVTHHQPALECILPQYRADVLSYAYANTRLDDLLAEQKDLTWICGHMHKQDTVKIGGTTVLTNARGYKSEYLQEQDFSFKEL